MKTDGPTTTPPPEYGNGEVPPYGVPPYGVPPSNGYYGMQPSHGYWPWMWPWYMFPYSSMGKPYPYGPKPSYGVQKPPAYGAPPYGSPPYSPPGYGTWVRVESCFL